ncbi:hypothetical protein [Streptomyces viridosporus]
MRISNTRSRRDKLTAEQMETLRKLGVEWRVTAIAWPLNRVV